MPSEALPVDVDETLTSAYYGDLVEKNVACKPKDWWAIRATRIM